MIEQLGIKKEADRPLEPGEEYLERTEKLLYSRLWYYIIAENWRGVGQVTKALVALKLI